LQEYPEFPQSYMNGIRILQGIPMSKFRYRNSKVRILITYLSGSTLT